MSVAFPCRWVVHTCCMCWYCFGGFWWGALLWGLSLVCIGVSAERPKICNLGPSESFCTVTQPTLCPVNPLEGPSSRARFGCKIIDLRIRRIGSLRNSLSISRVPCGMCKCSLSQGANCKGHRPLGTTSASSSSSSHIFLKVLNTIVLR